ncbi:MAG: sigma-54-dependent Fis family transcriptional regulator [Verrucomicrobia bacterium]|nr:MAG: sigma-54-dependent Fis family transcriptional regulator [Verrucomicrobiota bacterium]
MKNTDAAPRILIADDQADVLEALRLLLKGDGYRTETVNSPAKALAVLEEGDFDVVLMDLNYARDTTSGQEGLDLLGRIQALDSALPVVVMTAWANIELAVEAMRRGARDFIQKPWDNARLSAIIRNQVELGKALRKGQRLEAENELLRGGSGPALIAESPAMRPVLELINRVGPSDANVLITGENGTGKGVVARALHAISARSGKPLVIVNMGGLSEGVFESELFGHVKGAFTDAKTDRVGRFELADGGTLFLDEIANIPLNQQTKLLRVLETGEFERVGSSKTRRANVRLVSATNADVHAEVAAGRFRQDLLFRLNTVEIHLPPLRQRREDIPPLTSHFLCQHAQRYRKSVAGLEPAAVQMLQEHSWPGNVRELDHAVERAVLMAQGNLVKASNLGLRAGGESSPRLEEMSLEEVERHLIKKTLARCEGNAMKAAEALGLSRSAFYRRLEKYGL